MTQEDFIKVLKRKGYEYEIEGDKLVITEDGDVNLDALTSLPSGVEFRNRGDVWLNSLTSLPPGVVFRNGRNVYLNSLTSIPPGVEFKNGGAVWLKSLIRGGFQDWEGNIKGIESNRLLNLMIKKGIFEK